MAENKSGLYSDGGPPKILLVDDEPDTLSLIRKILEADGYRVFWAGDGLEALAVFEKETPDLVLLDVLMPKMDGMEALKEIRRRDEVAGVIMVSALTSEQLAVQSMLAGADDFVSKPFKLKAFRVRIRQTLDKSRLRRDNYRLRRQLEQTNTELEIANDKLRALFSRYMAAPVAERLLKSPTLPSLGGERQITTVLFMDFCNFTSLAQDQEPDAVVSILNERLAFITDAILAEDGTMDKFMGDGVMAFYNAPVFQPDHAMRAARSAVTMRDRIVDWNQTHSPPLDIRVGIHTGETVIGNIGTPQFMNYTAVGDTVNLAKRLQEHSDDNTIAISESTYHLLLPDTVEVAQLGPIQVRGRQNPVRVYRLKRLR